MVFYGCKDNDFVHNIRNPLDYDAVIVDELSMVDITLFSALLDALPLHCRLIMVGDKDQLPPVGAGNVLKDLIESDLIDVITLDKVFRQAMKSRIVTNAHRVVRGEMPVFDNSAESDFFLLKEDSRYNAPKKISDLVTKRIPASYGLSPMSDIQVLCPSRVGEVGTQNINKILQEKLNPPDNSKIEIKHSGFVLREGDRVMQIKNNYDVPWFKGGESGQGVFNGDIGILEDVDDKEKSLMVNYSGTYVFYPYDDLNDIALAYALSVHKAQGSEYQAVYFIFDRHNMHMLNRNLIYTAISRAKKKLVIIGNEQLLKQGISKEMKRRKTGLKELLEYE